MPGILQAESTLTSRYQTTVPASIREALHLEKHDKIEYQLLENGDVILRRSIGDDGEDPALASFLSLLERDIANHPERLQPLSNEYGEQLSALTRKVEFDLDNPLEDEGL